MLDNAGGPQYADHVIRVLEQLCYIEEPIVRQKATDSIKLILSKIRIVDFEQPLLEILTKLITNECIDPKKAAINLIPVVYVSVNQDVQKGLIKLFKSVVDDSAPQVRKEAAIILNDMILATPKFPEAILVEAFNSFYADQHDSVKMQCIDCCVSFSKSMQPNKV